MKSIQVIIKLFYFIYFFILDLPIKKIKKQTNKPSKLHDPKSAYAQTRWRRPLHNYSCAKIFSFFFFSETLVSGLRFICMS